MKWKTGSYCQVTPEIDIVKWANQPVGETIRPNTRKAKADAKRMNEFYDNMPAPVIESYEFTIGDQVIR